MRSVEVEVRTGSSEVVCDLGAQIEAFLAAEDGDGLLHVWVPHATAGLAVLETGAGSDDDLLAALRGCCRRTTGGGTGTAPGATAGTTSCPRCARRTPRCRSCPAA